MEEPVGKEDKLLYILLGEDDYSKHQFLEKIKGEVGDPVALASNTTVLSGQRMTPEELQVACGTVPFLAEKRLVIVEGLLARYEPAGKTKPTKKARPAEVEQQRARIAGYLQQVPEFTLLVLLEGKIGSRNPLLKEIAAHAEVKTVPLLSDARLRQWVQQRVEGAGGEISPRAVELLARLVGSNLWMMAGEIDKLVLYGAGRCIEGEDIRAVVSSAQEASVFALTDAVLESRSGAAGQFLQQLLQQGVAPAYVLVMLARQVAMAVRVKELLGQGKSRGEMQERLGLKSDYVLRKVLEQAGRYSLARLKEVHHRLLEADVSIKTGRFASELALDVLLAELCQGPTAPPVRQNR